MVSQRFHFVSRGHRTGAHTDFTRLERNFCLSRHFFSGLERKRDPNPRSIKTSAVNSLVYVRRASLIVVDRYRRDDHKIWVTTGWTGWANRDPRPGVRADLPTTHEARRPGKRGACAFRLHPRCHVRIPTWPTYCRLISVSCARSESRLAPTAYRLTVQAPATLCAKHASHAGDVRLGSFLVPVDGW